MNVASFILRQRHCRAEAERRAGAFSFIFVNSYNYECIHSQLNFDDEESTHTAPFRDHPYASVSTCKCEGTHKHEDVHLHEQEPVYVL